MAFGTLAIDTLQTSDSKKTGTSQTLDTSYVFNGSAKAWSHSGMDDNAIEDSFNTSGLADEGTGLVNYSFTTNFGSANHVDVAMIGNNSAHVFYNGSNAKAAGSTGTIRNYNTSNSATDPTIINVTSHGDLA